MSSKKLLNRLCSLAIFAGTSFSLTLPALSQGFLWPSASFFNPSASNFQSAEEEESVTLSSMLGMEDKYKIFNSRLQKSGLIETIEQQETVTVLAPTNKAFAALSPQLKIKLSDPENLKKVLQYHLVVGNIGEEDIKRQGVATLLKQNSVEITGIPLENERVGVKLNDALASDPLLASDGVIIPIDRVLIPPTLQ